jgi:AcrR family transcriptional regulator
MAREFKRIPSPERRCQILSVAAELFARQGFHGTTTRQIAERVGVKETILFRLFPGKEELYWAVIDQKCQDRPGRKLLESQLTAESNERKMFATIATGILQRNAQDPTLTRLLLFSGLEAHELSERFFQTYIAEYYETLATYIRQRVRDGAFRKVDPLLAARSFLGMVFNHFLVQELFGGERYQKFDIETVSETLVDIWLNGILKRT